MLLVIIALPMRSAKMLSDSFPLLANKTYKAVTGLPAAEEIKGFTGTNNYAVKDGRTGHIGVNLKSGVGYIYKIDATTATATRGLKVEGGTITAIEHLN